MASARAASLPAIAEFIFASTCASPVISSCEKTTAALIDEPGLMWMVSHESATQIDALIALSISAW